jgi:hypothetical protein
VLQNIYCERMRNEMQSLEERGKKKKSGTAIKIKEVNAKGRLLTSDQMIDLYAQHHNENQARAAEKEHRKDAREKHSEALKKWRAQEDERKKKCDEINARYQTELKAWETEKELAKIEKRCAGWKKPLRGPLPKPMPKPKKVSGEVENQNEEENDEESFLSSGSDRSNSKSHICHTSITRLKEPKITIFGTLPQISHHSCNLIATSF